MKISRLIFFEFLYFFWIFPVCSQTIEKTTQQRLAEGEIILDIRKEGQKSIVSAQAKPKVAAKWIWRALEDYEKFPLFFPNMQDCRIEKREKRSEDEEVLHVYNELIVSFKKIFYTLELTHRPKEGMIRWKMLSGNIKHTEGFWKIVPEGENTWITYEVYTDPGMWVPQFIYESMTTDTVRKVILGVTEQARFLERTWTLQFQKTPFPLNFPPPWLWENFLWIFLLFYLLHTHQKNAFPHFYFKAEWSRKNKNAQKTPSKITFRRCSVLN